MDDKSKDQVIEQLTEYTQVLESIIKTMYNVDCGKTEYLDATNKLLSICAEHVSDEFKKSDMYREVNQRLLVNAIFLENEAATNKDLSEAMAELINK